MKEMGRALPLRSSLCRCRWGIIRDALSGVKKFVLGLEKDICENVCEWFSSARLYQEHVLHVFPSLWRLERPSVNGSVVLAIVYSSMIQTDGLALGGKVARIIIACRQLWIVHKVIYSR